MPHTYEYPRPAVTVDCAIFNLASKKPMILLIRRGGEPFKGSYALPGGFVNIDETAETAAARELFEETGLKLGAPLMQIGAFSAVDRDPRGRVISIAYFGITDQTEVTAGDDAVAAEWFDARELPDLAFDHAEIIVHAMSELLEALKR